MNHPRTIRNHGCQMAIAIFLDHMCLALRASGRWLRYATLQNLMPSFPWIAPGWRAWGRNPRKGRDQILPSGNLDCGIRAEGPNRQKARLMCRPIDRPNIDPQFVDKSMSVVAVTRGGGASQLGYSSLARLLIQIALHHAQFGC